MEMTEIPADVLLWPGDSQQSLLFSAVMAQSPVEGMIGISPLTELRFNDNKVLHLPPAKKVLTDLSSIHIQRICIDTVCDSVLNL
jgi:hypothetical protein